MRFKMGIISVVLRISDRSWCCSAVCERGVVTDRGVTPHVRQISPLLGLTESSLPILARDASVRSPTWRSIFTNRSPNKG